MNHSQAETLESKTGVTVLRHSIKKPGCFSEIKDYFQQFNINDNEILVVGDRLFTDMLMANMMGSWGCWISEGVELNEKTFPKLERDLYQRLVINRPNDPYIPPVPK